MSLVIVFGEENSSNSMQIDGAERLPVQKLLESIVHLKMGFDSFEEIWTVLVVKNDKVVRYLAEEIWEFID